MFIVTFRLLTPSLREGDQEKITSLRTLGWASKKAGNNTGSLYIAAEKFAEDPYLGNITVFNDCSAAGVSTGFISIGTATT